VEIAPLNTAIECLSAAYQDTVANLSTPFHTGQVTAVCNDAARQRCPHALDGHPLLLIRYVIAK
jgi:hypothetical protein